MGLALHEQGKQILNKVQTFIIRTAIHTIIHMTIHVIINHTTYSYIDTLVSQL